MDMEATQHIEKRTTEYARTSSKEKSLNGWEALEEGWIKLNVDAVVSKTVTALAVVARNKNGEVLKVWAKMHKWCTPLQAEAVAIL